MFEKDSLIAGLLLGFFIPFVGYAVVLEIYDQLDAAEIISGFGTGEFRRRTSALLGLCMNLIPFAMFNRKRFFYSMRGIMIPTIIYAGIWFFYFGSKILWE
ncbi:MAG: hypothetical protein AB8F94_13005 [Saprospiraceae bacterium]